VTPLGWPHAASACLAFATSPLLSGPVGYGLAFVCPGTPGGSIVSASLAPATAPPRALIRSTLLSAYATASRQWMLSNGATSWLIDTYRVALAAGLSVCFFSDGLLRAVATSAVCRLLPSYVASTVPASSAWSSWVA